MRKISEACPFIGQCCCFHIRNASSKMAGAAGLLSSQLFSRWVEYRLSCSASRDIREYCISTTGARKSVKDFNAIYQAASLLCRAFRSVPWILFFPAFIIFLAEKKAALAHCMPPYFRLLISAGCLMEHSKTVGQSSIVSFPKLMLFTCIQCS